MPSFSHATDGTPIQVLSPDTSAKIAVAVASAEVILPTGTVVGDIVRVATDTDCYIVFGTTVLTADNNDVLHIAGVEMYRVPDGATYIAAIRVTVDGLLTITRMV